MKLPKKTLIQLIDFNKDWIEELKLSLQNPIQKMVGTGQIELKIIELETEVKKLESELK